MGAFGQSHGAVRHGISKPFPSVGPEATENTLHKKLARPWTDKHTYRRISR